MDFELTEEQKVLIVLVKDFAKREIDPLYIRMLMQDSQENLRNRIPWGILKKAHDIGLRTLAVPVKYGGGGADYMTQMLVGEELGRHSFPIAHIMAHLWSFCNRFQASSDEELQDEFFTQFMENPNLITAVAITEADAASDTLLPYDKPGEGMKTFAYRDGDEYIINGEKSWCTGGGQADIVIVYARTDKNAPISKGMSEFYVPTNTTGFSVVRANDMLYNELLRNAVIRFENVRIPARYLIGEENRSFLRRADPVGLIYLAPQIGANRAIYEATKEYAKKRVQGGVPIFEHKNIGPLIVDMYIRIETQRYLAYKVALEWDQATNHRTNRGVEGNISQLGAVAIWTYSKEVPLKLVESAAEVYGANAVMKDMPLEEYIRAAYLWQHGLSNRSLNLIKAMKLI
jgi:alkylation response protein AidB-like acyl-CoA dehydrogenase